MVSLEGTIGPRGMCRVHVEIVPPREAPTQDPRRVRAIVDTGAQGAMLAERVAIELRLPVEGVDRVALAFSEPITCMLTAADLVFHTLGPRRRHRVYTMRTSLLVAHGDFDADFDLILGANAWAGGDLLIRYPKQRWTFRTIDPPDDA